MIRPDNTLTSQIWDNIVRDVVINPNIFLNTVPLVVALMTRVCRMHCAFSVRASVGPNRGGQLM